MKENGHIEWMKYRIDALENEVKDFKKVFDKEKEERAKFVLKTTRILTVIDMKIKTTVVIAGAFFGVVVPYIVDFITAKL